MLLEETPSGNLRLFDRAKPDAGVRFSRADIRALSDFFELLDRWAREDDERRSKEKQ